jgi:hypothetical protein
MREYHHAAAPKEERKYKAKPQPHKVPHFDREAAGKAKAGRVAHREAIASVGEWADKNLQGISRETLWDIRGKAQALGGEEGMKHMVRELRPYAKDSGVEEQFLAHYHKERIKAKKAAA